MEMFKIACVMRWSHIIVIQISDQKDTELPA